MTFRWVGVEVQMTGLKGDMTFSVGSDMEHWMVVGSTNAGATGNCTTQPTFYEMHNWFVTTLNVTPNKTIQ